MIGDISVKTNLYVICGHTDMRRSIDGMCLLYKRLDGNIKGRFRWPRSRDEVKPITWLQFDWLMSGLDVKQPKALKMLAAVSIKSA